MTEPIDRIRDEIDRALQLDPELTRKEIADRAGLSAGQLTNLLTRPQPSLAKVQAVAGVLGLSLDWVAWGELPRKRAKLDGGDGEDPALARAIIYGSGHWHAWTVQLAEMIQRHHRVPSTATMGQWVDLLEAFNASHADAFKQAMYDEAMATPDATSDVQTLEDADESDVG